MINPEIKALAQAFTQDALNTIVAIMNHSDQDKLRLEAAKMVLDRAHGRVEGAVAVTGEVGFTVDAILQARLRGAGK